MAIHHIAGPCDCFIRGNVGILDQNIRYHSVRIALYYAGYDEEQSPEKDIDIVNKHDIAFWVLALETLAASLKTEFSPAETELYKMLQEGIKTQVTRVQISKNGFKEDNE
jgi:hypothetical protein